MGHTKTQSGKPNFATSQKLESAEDSFFEMAAEKPKNDAK